MKRGLTALGVINAQSIIHIQGSVSTLCLTPL